MSRNDVAPDASAALRSLDRLVGSWEITGDAEGTSRYEWMEGGRFLIQHSILSTTVDGSRVSR